MRNRKKELGFAALVISSMMGFTSCGQKEARDYFISINYELGMHCTGFDFSYCCVLPPYNSIQAQVVKHAKAGGSAYPTLLESDPKDHSILVDGEKRYKLHYEHVGNTYSEGNKMAYWNAPYDLDGDGVLNEAGESVANAYFRHLYIYQDLEGTVPGGTSSDRSKKFVGLDLKIPQDAGPSGQPVSNGFLHYSGERGVKVFTKGPVLDNVPILLTNPGIWDALGLPLTPFNDDDAAKGLMKLTEKDIQPYQMARVTLVDAESGKAVIDSTGRPVSYTGTNPIDVPNCYNCHSNENANGAKYKKYAAELEYWKSVGASEWFAELKSTAISIMEIHDEKHGTDFLSKYDPKATSNRLGRSAVLCQECHADNVIGKLTSKKVGDVVKNSANRDRVIMPLTQAIHRVHQMKRPLADSQGRTGSCQGCHPAHRQDRGMSGYPITKSGENAYADSDNRDAAGGCYVGRDVHSNKNADRDGAETKSYLNAIGHYLKENVMMTEGENRGLWCTNCHNQLSRELYERDNLTNAFQQTGETLRNRSLAQIAQAMKIGEDELKSRYIDPRVPKSGEDTNSGVMLNWSTDRLVPSIAVIQIAGGGPVIRKDGDGDPNVSILSANPNDAKKFPNGLAVPYSAASHGGDYWLSAGEPHCADCHSAPFVEGQGGLAFPINQPGKYSLMRYSKGHSGLSCQACHESIHGLYPVTPDVDQTTYRQAAELNPDGSHGPVKCASCHVVGKSGVPLIASELTHNGKPIGEDFEAAVEYIHASAPDLGGAIPKRNGKK